MAATLPVSFSPSLGLAAKRPQFDSCRDDPWARWPTCSQRDELCLASANLQPIEWQFIAKFVRSKRLH